MEGWKPVLSKKKVCDEGYMNSSCRLDRRCTELFYNQTNMKFKKNFKLKQGIQNLPLTGAGCVSSELPLLVRRTCCCLFDAYQLSGAGVK